jgi:GNAT superfamily N-acetyltransferase
VVQLKTEHISIVKKSFLDFSLPMNHSKISFHYVLDEQQKNTLFHLWNNEYPADLRYQNREQFDKYLNQLENLSHLLLTDENGQINGWAFVFDRENTRWFAIILDGAIQRRGYGKKLLETIQETESVLYGWVTDHDRDKKSNGETYYSPLGFYLKCGFEVLPDQRLETEKISAVKIKWESQKGSEQA